MKTHIYSRKGFTLVELLVSIAIVAALAGLAILGTKTALKAAAAAKTSNNMKSIGVVVERLISEGVDTGGNNPPGTFPPYEGTLVDDQQTDFIWWELIAEQMGTAERESSGFEWSSHPKDTELQNPLSTKKLGGSGEFTSFEDTERTRGGFAYNAELGGEGDGGEASLEGAFAAASLVDGPNTIIFAESDDNNTDPGYFFSNVVDAPQGNYKDGAHCYFYGNSVNIIKNIHLKDPNSFKFYTDPREKNYDERP